MKKIYKIVGSGQVFLWHPPHHDPRGGQRCGDALPPGQEHGDPPPRHPPGDRRGQCLDNADGEL